MSNKDSMGLRPLTAAQLATMLRNNIPDNEDAHRHFTLGMMCQVLHRLEQIEAALVRIDKKVAVESKQR